MILLYILLSIVVAYCLFQSVRFRIAAWGEKRLVPDVSRAVGAAISGRERDMEEAFLTKRGRVAYREHRVYDALGILAALVLLFTWASQTGLLDTVMQWTETLPEAEPIP